MRRYLMQSFNDQELVEFCFDYFPAVGDEFTQGMSKSQKVQLLLDYCRRYERAHDLLGALARERPGPFVDELLADSQNDLPIISADTESITQVPRQVFISYANQDAEIANHLAEDLLVHGWQVWIAPNSIQPGEKWVEAINRGLAESGVFLLVLTDTAVQSQWVRSETNIAIQWEHQEKLRFIPLKVTEQNIEDVPALWLAYQQVDMTVGRKTGLEALFTELEPAKMTQLVLQYVAFQEAVKATSWKTVSELGLQIESEYPDFRDVCHHLEKADKALDHTQQRNAKLASLYDQVIVAIHARDWETALDLGEQVFSIGGNYRDVENLMAQVGQILQQQRRQARLARLYVQMQAAVHSGSWGDALNFGRKITTINPQYRKVQQLINEAHEQLRRVSGEVVASQRQHVFWGWWVGGLVGLILLGLGIRAASGNSNHASIVAVMETAVVKTIIASPETATHLSSINPDDVLTKTPAPIFTSTVLMATPTPSPTQVADPSIPTYEPILGSTWLRPADNMTMIYVPAGTFPMGSENASSNELPMHPVTLNGYWIDQTEVTQAQYDQCVTAGVCTPPAYSISTAHYPVVGVSWNNADVYCRWTGGELPTEAQWEYAARGEEGYFYPWGDEAPTCDLAQFGACDYMTLPVGSFPDGASWVGALDMAGNVREWVNDWYIEDFDQLTLRRDPQGPSNGTNKVLRGGSWNYYQSFLRSTVRDNSSPISRYDSIGFRCARNSV